MARLKGWWRGVRPKVLGGTAHGVVRLLASTVRMELVNEPADLSNSICSGWHGRSLLFANYYRNRGWWVIISQSNDGEIQTRIFRRFGYQIIRGSTGRGGVRAAIEGIRALKAGGTMAMTPDGPRGPSGVVQGGVMLMAHKSGARLYPVGVAASPRWLFKSWDRYMVPKPFARGVIMFGEPIVVPADADEAGIEACRLQFEAAIHAIEAEAEAYLAR